MAQNYSDQDLQNQNFERQNLRGADFSRADLRGANFSRAKLFNANFSDAKLQGANFSHAYLREAKFTGASDNTISSDNVTYVDGDIALPCVNFKNAKIQGTDFTGATLIRANFEKTQSGLKMTHTIWVIFVTIFFCILSSFTSTIISSFAIYYFFLTLRQKPSSVVLLLSWFCSLTLIIAIRTFLLGNLAISVHTISGIALIVITTASAYAVKVSIDDTKTDTGYIIWTVIALLALLIVFLFTSSLKGWEELLLKWIPNLARYVKGLGTATEGGTWIAGIFGAAIGGGLGWHFSKLALIGDKRFSWLWKMYVEFAVSGGTTFNGSDLTDANFTAASVRSANFKAFKSIKRVRWYKVRHFEYCCLEGGYIALPKIQQLVMSQEVGRLNSEDLNFDGLDLEGINLESANLSSASFVGTNLNEANLRGANLSEANLTQTKLDGADLRESTLTGACILNWTITSKTKLNKVKCEYVFLAERADSKSGIRERHPHAPNKIFEPGEFEKRYTENVETLQLRIRNSDNRQALTAAFWDLIQKNPDITPDNLQGFDKISGGVVVKIRVSQETDKGTVEQEFDQTYEAELSQVMQGGHQNAELQRLIGLLEIDNNQPQLIEFIVKLIEIGAKMRSINTGGGNYYESINTHGGDYIQGDYINMSQDLAHAAAQIQDLIENLQRRGVNVDVAQEEVARDIATQAQNDPTIKDKLVRWGQSLGDATVSDVVKGAVKLAIRSAGIPLP
ncbi:pentapeptide repeat-containing protein [Aetokthonos hydrillicola Thurmond2011]|jgi:uncharacterized protein YjbI with pentapeptide repeats|uniref:Pentapeptide repeat-containing protein n=1 Tax=Aetokthonos hydrillicola Thurmond2011 TaxID=2712845 RepID=A0AAP5IA95_9CYAN|nr:pentapeptide repeat-containing protein [Aetokthonos hydrillicola]MBO3458478.1 pentapeptide repeat-containing protein [Aetokthonos hydrillicola CCALA 1050]MBW4586195.1 pentapeptide repeat-containing protein [Aetokthonos hydrillicola CCALA 1050]MDR9897805.1 pentapeptide repeat-containing protein [Aetokthonos hydrillicola Thurmond2011]